jgi:hypothetical protein
LLAVQGAVAATPEPVRRIPVFVPPYYAAARTPEERPKVEVGRRFDHALASTERGEIAAARDAVEASPGTVTPMTLMVLAIRLYDVGLRDDAVFWFYVARARYITLEVVADMKSPQLVQVEDATRNFAILAGPTINGYAFCDISRQQEIRAKAMQWVIDNPYKALFLPQVPARPGDREANLKKAVVEITAAAAKEREYLAKPANVADLKAKRKENDADRKFCWK